MVLLTTLIRGCLLIAIVFISDHWSCASTIADASSSEIDEATTDPDCGCGGISRQTSNPSVAISIDNVDVATDNIVVEELGIKIANRSLKEEPHGPTIDMVFIPGGDTFMGTDKPQVRGDGESPLRTITLSPYFIDRYSVTNDDFAKFVAATGYITESEKFGWSFVFHSAIADHIKAKISQAVLGAEWWLPVNGSYWKEPEGPGTDVFRTHREKHPVTQVSWNDAVKYCEWRGSRLPTEAEWEVAARGPPKVKNAKPKSPTLFPWGNQLVPKEGHRMNVFQGTFPVTNTADDGYEFTAPVDAFGPQNDYGVYNMIGNVWEWVFDWHTIYHPTEHQVDPVGPPMGRDRVKKGGSFLCHRSYCYRYRTVARFPTTPDSATINIGFRCGRSATSEEMKERAALQTNDDEDL